MSTPPITITIIGNLTRDPELRTTASGATVVNFTIASSPRTFNRDTNQWEDGDPLFLNCNAWNGKNNTFAANIANSLRKGMRVIAQGRLSPRSYQAQDGTQRTVVELRVDDIGPALSNATAQVQRMQNSQQSGFQPQEANQWGSQPTQSHPQSSNAPVNDPWSNPPDNQDKYRQALGTFGMPGDGEPEF